MKMKMKILLYAGVLAAVLALNLCALANEFDSVSFEGQVYCLGVEDCRNFASWGPTAGGVFILTEPDGTPSDYLWVNPDGTMTFESDNESGGFALLPPAGLPVFGTLVEDGTLQQINQFFPGGLGRPLYMQSDVVEGTTPEPSTLLLFGPAAVFLFGRARRLWRA